MKISYITLLTLIFISLLSSTAIASKISVLDKTNSEGFYNQANNLQKQVNTTSHEIRAAGVFPIDIPDNDPAGINLVVDATGFFTGNIESLTLELEIEHTYVGDLSATLTAPNGIAQLVVLSRIGRTPELNFGYGSNLIGVYTFNDQATQDIWTTAAANNATLKSNLPVGQYRTSTAGTDLSRFGGCTTRLNGAFKGLTPSQTNGIWTLNISDNEGGDVGQLLSLNLLADQDNSNAESIFKSGFEVEYASLQLLPASDVLGNCKKAQFDFSGNGLSDYALSYESSDDDLILIYANNTGNATSGMGIGSFILSPNALNPVLTSGGDFDGDGITDVVVRVDNSIGGYDYLIIRSTRPNDVRINVPTTLDINDPQFGDYDGDGLDDLAWFFAPEISAGNTIFLIINSSDFSQLLYPMEIGNRSDFRTAGGFDHTGDGIADIFLLINDGTGDQIAKIYDGTDGDLIQDSETAFFTNITRQLPGYFLDGDRAGLGLLAVDIQSSDNYLFGIYDDNDATFPTLSSVSFGDDPTDTPLTGDYDGDGIDDFGVWRPDTDGMGARFIIRPSGSADPDNNLIEVSPDGAVSSDIPLGNVRVR